MYDSDQKERYLEALDNINEYEALLSFYPSCIKDSSYKFVLNNQSFEEGTNLKPSINTKDFSLDKGLFQNYQDLKNNEKWPQFLGQLYQLLLTLK